MRIPDAAASRTCHARRTLMPGCRIARCVHCWGMGQTYADCCERQGCTVPADTAAVVQEALSSFGTNQTIAERSALRNGYSTGTQRILNGYSTDTQWVLNRCSMGTQLNRNEPNHAQEVRTPLADWRALLEQLVAMAATGVMKLMGLYGAICSCER
jgi:hypothetical protein